MSWSERWLLCRAAFWLLAVGIGLRLLPVRVLLEWTNRKPAPGRSAARENPHRIAWLVDVVAGHLRPRSSCLPRSLVLCGLLRERGWAARLVIGTTSPAEGFQAHAWVELDGKIPGPQGPTNYQKLAEFGSFRAGDQLI